jgi:putative phosphoribosyl transferase
VVRTPTLFIVGGDDTPVLDLNRQAYERLHCEKRLVVIPGATHLFEEPGALDRVAQCAREWFEQHLARQPIGGAPQRR